MLLFANLKFIKGMLELLTTIVINEVLILDKKLTIKDIAKIVGVSDSTVSRALSNYPHVNEEKRKLIHQIADELGYYPNIHAKNLRNRKGQDIGLIIPEIQNPFYASVTRGIEDFASKNGYNLLLCNSDFDPLKEEKYINLLLSKQVEGLIIFPTMLITKKVQTLKKRNIPFVLVDFNPQNLHVNCIYADQQYGAYIAMKYLIERGHRDIVYYNYEKGIVPPGEQMEKGYRQALKEANIKFRKNFIYTVKTIDKRTLYENTYQLLSKKETLGYTAIICVGDVFALSIYEIAPSFGIKIPEDLSLIGYDDIFICPFLNPPLTSVNQPQYELGEQAIELLLREINSDSNWQYQTIRLIPWIAERKSVKAINKIY